MLVMTGFREGLDIPKHLDIILFLFIGAFLSIWFCLENMIYLILIRKEPSAMLPNCNGGSYKVLVALPRHISDFAVQAYPQPFSR
jgi:hypothetical protein